jgi:hypothetical protein
LFSNKNSFTLHFYPFVISHVILLGFLSIHWVSSAPRKRRSLRKREGEFNSISLQKKMRMPWKDECSKENLHKETEDIQAMTRLSSGLCLFLLLLEKTCSVGIN